MATSISSLGLAVSPQWLLHLVSVHLLKCSPFDRSSVAVLPLLGLEFQLSCLASFKGCPIGLSNP